MAASDTYRMGDIIPWAPLSAPASIYPLTTQAPPDSQGTASLEALGGPLPWGCEEAAPAQEDRR